MTGSQVIDGRGKLQLAVRLPVRLPRRRGEDRHLAQGDALLLGRDGDEGAGSSGAAGLGRRPLLCR